MHLETKIFSSKISWRIFANFMICALVPVGCLAILTYYKVTAHLEEHAFNSLRHSVKSQAKTLVDRLDSIDKELALISSMVNGHALFEFQQIDARFRSRLLKRFNSIAFFENPDKLKAANIFATGQAGETACCRPGPGINSHPAGIPGGPVNWQESVRES